jgi:hypothetical protein
MRTLGTGPLQAMPGDAHPGGPPSGTVPGGSLTGSYPSPTIATGAVGASQLAELPGMRFGVTADGSLNASPPSAGACVPAPSGNEGTLFIPISGLDSDSYEHDPFDLSFMTCGGHNYLDALVVPVDGTYSIAAMVGWPSNATGDRRLRVTRTTQANATTELSASEIEPVHEGTKWTIQNVGTIASLTAGDKVRIRLTQDSTTTAVDSLTEANMALSWIGPGAFH